jgi:hypothetical protein
MSISADTSLAGCAKNIASDLKEWATAQRGGFSFSRDPFKTIELLSNAPDGLTLVLSFEESAFESDNVFNQPRRMRYTASVIINDPLDISQEADYTRSPNDNLALLEIVDSLEKRILSFTPPSADANRNSDMDRVKYEGTSGLILPDGQPLRGYGVKFSFRIKSPLLTLRP